MINVLLRVARVAWHVHSRCRCSSTVVRVTPICVGRVSFSHEAKGCFSLENWWVTYYYTVPQKKTPPSHYFCITRSESEQILIILVPWILKIFDIGSCTLVHHTWKLSPHYLVKCRTFSAEGSCMISSKSWTTSKNSWLLCCPETWISDNQYQRKVTIVCVDTFFLSFLLLIYYHVVSAFSPLA